MSKMNQSADEDAKLAAVDNDDEAASGMSKLFASLLERAVGLDGRLDPSVKDGLALSKASDRKILIESLLSETAPEAINPEHWLGWLSGGKLPPSINQTLNPKRDDRSSGKVLDRRSKVVETAEAKVERAKKQLEQAQSELQHQKNVEKAVLQWAFGDQLLRSLSPMFAMGPAWTIMRSISAHLDAEAMATKTSIAGSEKHRLEIENSIIAERREETERLMRSLDMWCGDAVFEEELRIALLEIVARYEPHEAERNNSSNRGRGREARRVQVNPNSTAEAEAVLDGLKL